MKIVIVDDSASIRQVLAALLESHGHQVVAALADGASLFDCVRHQAPDVACIDYHLPGQNGLALIAAMQASSPDVDVVMITASSDPDLVGRAANAGAAGFLHKPFSQQQILEELRRVEENRRVVAKAHSTPTDADSGEPGQVKRTAVVVDDAGSMRLLLKGLLEEMGLRVLQTVADGKEAVAAAKKHLPDVICMDVEMPGMSGMDALPLIVEASPQTKVVMVTGNASKALVEKAAELGAKGYILKPVRPAHVHAFMKKLLG